MLVMNSYGEFVDAEIRPWEVTVPDSHGNIGRKAKRCGICGGELPKHKMSYCSDECASEAKRRGEYKRRKGGYTWRR